MRTVVLNKPEIDPATGIQYPLDNTQRTPHGRHGGRAEFEQFPGAATSAPVRKRFVSPAGASDRGRHVHDHSMDLLRKQVVGPSGAASGQANPEQLRERIKQELMFELKERELALREREIAAKEASTARAPSRRLCDKHVCSDAGCAQDR